MNQESVLRWIVCAVADGWSIKPTYPPGETADSAAKLDKDGFHVQALARPNESSIHIWGTDELVIRPSIPYDWDAIVEGTKICHYCGNIGKTVRIGFAGRCCPECREKHKKEVEYPGWTC